MPLLVDNTLTLRDRIADSAALNLDEVWTVYTHIVGGVTYVYVAGSADDGISVFSLADDGTLTFEHNINDTNDSFLDGVTQILVRTVGTTEYMYVSSRLDDAINVYRVEGDGDLTFMSALNGVSLNLDNAAGKMSTAKIGGATYLIVPGGFDDGFTIFEARANGNLTARDIVSDSVNLDFIYDTATIEIGANHYLFTASFNSDTLSAYQIDNMGQATLLYHLSDSANNDLDLNGLVGLTTGTINGTNFLFSASLVDDTVTVFTIDSAGALTEVFSVADAAGLKLDGTHGLEFIELAGAHYLAVTGRSDNAISFFQIDNSGALSLLSDVTDSYLANALYVAFAEVGGQQFLISGGENAAGIVSYEIGGADNVMIGGADDDILLGFGGNDILDGGLGNDVIDGGGGIDTLDMSAATAGVTAVLLTNNSDTGYTTGALGNDVLRGIENIEGSNFSDNLFGTLADNVIYGNDGDDVLNGGSGNDTLYGGAGTDQIFGQDDDDFIDGGAGDDSLYSGLGSDTINGGAGNDQIYNEGGPGTLDGGDGSDALILLEYSSDYVIDLRDGLTNRVGETAVNFENIRTGVGNDTVTGTDGGNRIEVLDGHDTIYGLGGDDVIFGGNGDNIIYGGDGNDSLSARDGNSERYGEAGNDSFSVLFNFSIGMIDGGEGFDTIDARSSSIDRTIDASGSDITNIERIITGNTNDTIIGDDTVISYRGGDGDDHITTGDGNNYIDAGDGNDTVYGGNGNDVVELKTGDDIAYLCGGDDIVYYRSGADTLDGGAGNDRAFFNTYQLNFEINLATGLTNISGVTAVNFESVSLGGGDDIVLGNAADNLISGGGGDDYISGGAGDDRLFGETGNDTLHGGDGNDIAIFFTDYNDLTFSRSGDVTTIMGQNETDTLEAIELVQFGSFFLPVHALGANEINGTDLTDTNLIGTAATDIIFGDSGDDTLRGLEGDDALLGGNGNDILYGGAGADFIDGGNGNDTLYADTDDDFFFLIGGFGTDTLYIESEVHLDNDYQRNGFETAFVQNAAGQTLQIFTASSSFSDTQLQTLDFDNSQIWSLTVLDTDVTDIQNWNTRIQFRNEAGQNYEIHFENDDGTSSIERYDVENDDSYSVLTLNYNALGQLDTVINDWDSGRRVTTDYDPDNNEGFNLSIFTQDLANEGLWNSVLDYRNDSGQRYFLQNNYDNTLRVELVFDVENDDPYFRVVTNFDDSAAGDLLNYQTATFYQTDTLQTYQIDLIGDDDVRAITDYDLLGAQIWASQRVRTDEANIYTWGTITEQFNASNQRLFVSQTNEGSYDTSDEFDLLGNEIWSQRKIYTDDEDLYDWTSITFLFDNNGDIYETEYVYDS